MSTKNLLMIFTKNPILGKGKTRLAQTMGDEKALQIYQKLLEHTYKIKNQVLVDRTIFYSYYVNEDDIWGKGEYQKIKQKGDGLGEKMSNAFKGAFNMGYKSVVIFGSDCFELNEVIMVKAFKILEENEAVLGPVKDVGYYLLGMKKGHQQFFENKSRSNEHVLLETLLDLSNLNLTYQPLPTLSDIDEGKDLINCSNIIES